MSEDLNIIIDNFVISEYEDYYFKLHPRAKKAPIASPNHPSINHWMVLQRQSMNALKQKWKNFITWVVEKNGYANMRIKNCRLEVITYYSRKIRHDVDNYVPKFILDGFVESGFLIDDDDEHISSLTLKCAYDKSWPRTEIKVYIEKKEHEE